MEKHTKQAIFQLLFSGNLFRIAEVDSVQVLDVCDVSDDTGEIFTNLLVTKFANVYFSFSFLSYVLASG